VLKRVVHLNCEKILIVIGELVSKNFSIHLAREKKLINEPGTGVMIFN
jgi:hypothetical protein